MGILDSTYLLSEDRLGLTTKTLLFSVVTTSTLGTLTLLGLLVLSDFVQFVALALLAEGATLFWYVYLKEILLRNSCSTLFSFVVTSHKNLLEKIQNIVGHFFEISIFTTILFDCFHIYIVIVLRNIFEISFVITILYHIKYI